MFGSRFSQYSAIGLQILPYGFRALQLDTQGRIQAASQQSWRTAAGENSAENDDRLVMFLKQAIQSGGFRGRNVVLAIPPQDLWVHNVRLPQVPPEELPQVARFEAEERLPYPIDEVELQLITAGDVKQDNVVRHEVILLACRKQVIEHQIRLCERANLIPQAIDVEANSLVRTQQTVDGARNRTVFLHLGEQLSTVLFADGDKILFLKYIMLGTSRFDRAIAQELELNEQEARQLRITVNEAEELNADDDVHRSVIDAIRVHLDSITNEVEMCLRYCKVTFRGRPVEQMWLSGEGVSAWLADYLSDRFNLPVTLCRNSELNESYTTPMHWEGPQNLWRMQKRAHAANPRQKEYLDGRWVIAQGLALRGLNLKSNPAIPTEDDYTLKTQQTQTAPVGTMANRTRDEHLPGDYSEKGDHV